MADTITALWATGGQLATKTHTRKDDGQWATASYQSGATFYHRRRDIDGIRDLHAALAALADKPSCFVIRGDVRPDAGDIIRRIYKPRPDVPNPAILDADRQWLCLDIDGAPADPTRDHVAQARELLPDWLRRASCVWRYSASHGVKTADQLRLHLWFWLSRPVGNVSLRRWAEELPYIDGALYNPCQPHYTARPAFTNADDPVAVRLGLYVGEADVAVPPLEFLPSAVQHELDELRSAEARRQTAAYLATRPASYTATSQERWARWVRQDLDALAATGEGNRHKAIWRYARRIASLAHASDAARDARPDIERVALGLFGATEHGRRRGALRRVDEGWTDGLADPRDVTTR